jgi:hypothetical protein
MKLKLFYRNRILWYFDRMGKNTIEKEKAAISMMIELYCHDKHASGKQLCADCADLLEYAHARLDKCPFGDDKGVCSQCKVHCYKPEMRQKVIEVMRYAGPRMMKKHPIMALKHLWKEKFRPKK